jgi:CRISPR-associated protein Cmr2
MKHYFVVTIGPVQDFIKTARRTRDLWFGSWLLSELAKSAAMEIVRKHNDNLDVLIFPAPSSIDALKAGSSFIAPNKLAALVDLSHADTVEALGKAVADAVRARLETLRSEALCNLPKKLCHSDTETVSKVQVDDLPEIAWAAAEIRNGDYRRAREQAERFLAARKTTREFKEATWGSDRPKSSLDGQRESVLVKLSEDDARHADLRREARLCGVRPGEQLCGVGVLKRLGQRGGGEDRFYSTPHVAALPFVARLNARREQVKPHYDKYIEILTGDLKLSKRELGNLPKQDVAYEVFGRNDAHILFENRLKEYFDDKAERDKVTDAKKALDSFYKAVSEQVGNARPAPYYAILHADGDHMGAVIDTQDSSDNHRRLSADLAKFASQAEEIVRRHKGALVYSGGDDVLALVPLHTVLQCARELSDAFKSLLSDFCDRELKSPTLSVGVAVSHCMDPLSDALDLARAAEKKAKSVPGKNALAVSVDKRSGVVTTVCDSWCKLDVRLERFIQLHRLGAFPDGAAYQLRDLSIRLDEAGERETKAERERNQKTKTEILHLEAERILKRKRTNGGAEAVSKSVLTELDDMLKSVSSVRQFADELIVARIFADARNLAFGEPDASRPEHSDHE